ncbi:DnaJ domain-containing protein [Chytriomyces cf. hyalinus JEL632]|nr:DnaJ domain-containing protein [Chytriomyces cf. hyalinus JEL632]
MKCHYEVLAVDRTADDAELKKAYRKKALELHPDKNPHRIEEATQLFALVQNAYQVLTDPHERSWYDSHRESILRGDDDPVQSASAPTSKSSISLSALMAFFSSSAYSTFDDRNPANFFSVYSKLFDRLQKEEIDALNTDPDALVNTEPNFHFEFDELVHFGHSGSMYPREFYNRFLTFQTNKSFRWHDRYRLGDAQDRAVRRAMDVQNQKLRSAARKEFSEIVRNLALFVQKRDPRYRAMLDQEKIARQQKEAELKEKRRIEKEQVLKKVEVFEVADWAKGPQVEYDDDEIDGDVELNEFYCAACSRLFKSDRQWRNHEVSKKHLKNVEILRRQLLEDDELLFNSNDQSAASIQSDDDDDETDGDAVEQDRQNSSALAAAIEKELRELDLDLETPEDATLLQDELPISDFSEAEQDEPIAIPIRSEKSKKKKKDKKKKTGLAGFSDADDDLDEPASIVEEEMDRDIGHAESSKKSKPLAKPKSKQSFGFLDPEDEPDVESNASKVNTSVEESKLSAKEKKKLREAKKAEKDASLKLVCSVCSAKYATRNELFDHLDVSGHAVVKGGTGKKGRK